MSENSGIQWTNHTFNPWWGCVKVAQGCKFCYAEGVAERFCGRRVWGPNSERRLASEKVWNDPVRWNRAAERGGQRAKVFCLSMGDVLEDHPQLAEPRKRLVEIVETTPWLDWQLLTKRPENAEMFGWGHHWPANVWFGTSAATHEEMYRNAPHLLGSRARVKFWSLEPLIGRITMTPACMGDWVIVGGESGSHARPCDVGWIQSIVAQCKTAGVPCFVKQLGARILLPNDSHDQWPRGGDGLIYDCDGPGWSFQGERHEARLRDHKGGNPDEWPEDLRVREFPLTPPQSPAPPT